MAKARNKQQSGGLFTLLGIAAGAVIGAGVALVYSPDNGEQNRQHLRQWTQARVNETQSKAQAKAHELQSKTQAKAQELQSKAQARVEELQTRVEDKVMG